MADYSGGDPTALRLRRPVCLRKGDLREPQEAGCTALAQLGPEEGRGGDVASADEKPEQLGCQTPERRAESVRVRGGCSAPLPAGQLARPLVSTQSSD